MAINFLCIALYKWGAGTSIKEARKNARTTRREPHCILEHDAKMHMDEMGRVYWSGDKRPVCILAVGKDFQGAFKDWPNE